MKIPWEFEEVVALIAFYNEDNNNLDSAKIDLFTNTLHKRASILGIEADSKFRNSTVLK